MTFEIDCKHASILLRHCMCFLQVRMERQLESKSFDELGNLITHLKLIYVLLLLFGTLKDNIVGECELIEILY